MHKFLIQTNIPIFHHSLAQTWLARPEFYRLSSQDITAITAFSRQVAPGQAIIPSGLNETCSIKIIVISMSYTISETYNSKSFTPTLTLPVKGEEICYFHQKISLPSQGYALN